MERNRSQLLLTILEMLVGGLNLETYMWPEMVIERSLTLTRSLWLVAILMKCELSRTEITIEMAYDIV